MSNGKLAIHGGKPAISGFNFDRWRNIHLRDLLPIVKYACLGRNTMSYGPPIERFEREFADLTQTQYALAMNSGTAALHSAYVAVGIRPGTEVIVPTYSWFAAAAAVLQCGATPVFCDIDARTLTASVDDVERRVTSRTKAICVVHVWGNPAAMDRFVDVARRNKLSLIEDCSHAHGAMYKGRPVGSWGDIGCFSLQGSKAVSGGEGGVAVTNSPVLFDRMLALGHNGRTSVGQIARTFEIDNMSFGLKYRPHLYSVILARASLSRLAKLNDLRRANYEILCSELTDCPSIIPIQSYQHAVRGGFLAFVLKYNSELDGGWSLKNFVSAAQAEGVPIRRDPYSREGENSRLLHEVPLFQNGSKSQLGGYLADQNSCQGKVRDPVILPTAECLGNQLVSLPAFARVSEPYLRKCAFALRRVAHAADGSAMKWGRRVDF